MHSFQVDIQRAIKDKQLGFARKKEEHIMDKKYTIAIAGTDDGDIIGTNEKKPDEIGGFGGLV